MIELNQWKLMFDDWLQMNSYLGKELVYNCDIVSKTKLWYRLKETFWLKTCQPRLNLNHLKSNVYTHESYFLLLIEIPVIYLVFFLLFCSYHFTILIALRLSIWFVFAFLNKWFRIWLILFILLRYLDWVISHYQLFTLDLK